MDSVNSFSTGPLLSPDSRYLAYQVVENRKSSDQCDRQDCSSRFFHVWDIHSGEDIELLPLVEPWLAGEPYFMHCNLEWSPTGRFVAFSVGCGLQEPSSIAIIDVENHELVEVINAEDIDSYIRKYKWLSGDRLIVQGTLAFATSNEHYEGYLLYLAADQSWYPLENMPERNIYDYDLVTFRDWTKDGTLAVGQTQVPGEKRAVELIIFEVKNEGSNGEYVQTPDEYVDLPLWSPSDSFVSYRSYNWETATSKSRFIVVNRSGQTLLDTGMLDVVSPHFAWLLQP